MPPAAPVSRDRAAEILQFEDSLRKSPEIQQRMADAEADELSDWIRIAAEVVQPRVAEKFGISIYDLQRLLVWYPDLSHLILYGRYNRARPGSLVAGSPWPNVSLVPFSSTTTSMTSIRSMFHRLPTKPLLLIAGSIT